MTVALPFIVCVAGALVYALSSNGKVSRMGEIAYFVGLLWLIYSLAGAKIHLL